MVCSEPVALALPRHLTLKPSAHRELWQRWQRLPAPPTRARQTRASPVPRQSCGRPVEFTRVNPNPRVNP